MERHRTVEILPSGFPVAAPREANVAGRGGSPGPAATAEAGSCTHHGTASTAFRIVASRSSRGPRTVGGDVPGPLNAYAKSRLTLDRTMSMVEPVGPE
jgi:hypothetical protein